jgi:SAM-dependent methyltransferase
MTDEWNPQAAQMADESMVRNLAAQAEAIWPQEVALFRRHGLGGALRVLDAGCGTGEITRRLAELYPEAELLGVDVEPAHLARAAAGAASFGARVRFEQRSVFDLGLADGSFDLTVCRHVLQALPHPERVLAELARVTRGGGRLHLIAEDYGMIAFPPGQQDTDRFWSEVPYRFGAATGTDLHIGRKAYGHLRRLGLTDISVDYIIVDPLRVGRETMAAIFTAWRDGYADAIGAHTTMSREQASAHFDDSIATLRDPEGYAVWFVPVVTATVP